MNLLSYTGGPLQVPAIYKDLPMEVYLDSPLLGSSELRDYWKRGPRFYQMKHVLGMYKDDSTEAQIFGQAFEIYLHHGAAAVRARFPMRPPSKLEDGTDNPEANFAKKEGKAWLARNGFKRADDVPLSDEDLIAMHGMAQAIEEHGLAYDCVSKGYQQYTFTAPATDNVGNFILSGLKFQSRPDYVFLDGQDFLGFCPSTVDLKALKSESFRGMGMTTNAIVDSFYEIQAAIARMSMRAQGIRNSRHYILAVEKGIPHRMDLVELAPSFLDMAEQRILELASRIDEHHRLNDWPRSFPGSRQLQAPKWYTGKLPSDIDEP